MPPLLAKNSTAEPRPPRFTWQFLQHPLQHPGIAVAAGVATIFLTGVLFLFGVYVKYSWLTDKKLKAGAFLDSVDIFSSPMRVGVGDQTTPARIIDWLQKCEYVETPGRPGGHFRRTAQG